MPPTQMSRSMKVKRGEASQRPNIVKKSMESEGWVLVLITKSSV